MATHRPNIIFILIDDLGWKDLSYAGSEFYETPHIDRLASEGMRFSDAYASCPVCSPTRASVMTGKYPATVGITDWIDYKKATHPRRGRLIDVPYLDALPRSEYALPQPLNASGYATWHVGKWHLGGEGSLPEDHGFQVNIAGSRYGNPGPGGYFSPWTLPGLEDAPVPEGTDLTDYLTDQAIALVEAQPDDQPFFLNLWHYTVHTPIQAKPHLIRKYEEKRRRLGLDKVNEFEEGPLMPWEGHNGRRIIRRQVQSDPVYAAMVETLDDNVGRLMDALERTGKADHTLVIFTSDNGGLATAEGSPTCNAPLAEGKGWVYEGGTREPLIARWPGVIEAGSVCHEPVTTPDFYPTFLDAAEASPRPDQSIDGTSLMPLFRGEASLPRDAIFWHYPHYGNQGGTPACAIREGNYKLIRFFEDERIELYNLSQDPGEDRNLAATEPEKARTLNAKLTAWQESVEARIPQANPGYRGEI